jgi:hypothetical protein
VVTGNEADGQLQLSIFADLFDTVRLYVDNGHALDTDTGHLLSGYADQACDAWRQRDAGMWELPRREHYTSSNKARLLRARSGWCRRCTTSGAPARRTN